MHVSLWSSTSFSHPPFSEIHWRVSFRNQTWLRFVTLGNQLVDIILIFFVRKKTQKLQGSAIRPTGWRVCFFFLGGGCYDYVKLNLARALHFYLGTIRLWNLTQLQQWFMWQSFETCWHFRLRLSLLIGTCLSINWGHKQPEGILFDTYIETGRTLLVSPLQLKPVSYCSGVIWYLTGENVANS